MPLKALLFPALRPSKFSRSGLSGRPATEKRTRGGELVACCSGATVAVNPAAVVAGNETGTAALHFADRIACADAAALVTAVVLRSGGGRDGDGKSEQGDEERLHVVI